jgi:hypothetical protein
MKELTIQFIVTGNYLKSNNNKIHLNILFVLLNERYIFLSEQMLFKKQKLINNLKYLIHTWSTFQFIIPWNYKEN